MCLIIHKPADADLFTAAQLRDYASHNPNGFGMMWAEGGKVHIEKTLDMKRVGEMIARMDGREAVFHWRYTTHGNDSIDNTHPFMINDELAMMHNGILPCKPDDMSKSDTWEFAHNIMPVYLGDGKRVGPDDIARLDEWIGVGNRLVFMDADGVVTIVGHGKGIVHRGCWYSNEYAWTSPSTRAYTRSVAGSFDKRAWLNEPASFDATDPWGLPRLDGQTVNMDEEIIVLDEISKRDSFALESFKKDLEEYALGHGDYAEASALVDWYCGKADDYATLAVLLWNAIRESIGVKE